MDKYLLIVMIFLVVTIPIAFVEPSTGDIRDRPFFELMWIAIAGIIIIFLYNARKEGNQRRAANAKRRSKK